MEVAGTRGPQRLPRRMVGPSALPVKPWEPSGRVLSLFLVRVVLARSGTVAAVKDEHRCPICGQGVLQELGPEADAVQGPETRQRQTYSCGHDVAEPPLEATARDRRLEVERRSTEDTVEPPPEAS
jgi:hypothetical protein